jgi:hypothetical protein
VWWVAAPYGASYYGLDPAIHAASSARAGGRVFVVVNREPRELASLPEPDAVLLSRRDTYDMRGAVSDYLARNAYRRDDALLGFEVWTR